MGKRAPERKIVEEPAKVAVEKPENAPVELPQQLSNAKKWLGENMPSLPLDALSAEQIVSVYQDSIKATGAHKEALAATAWDVDKERRIARDQARETDRKLSDLAENFLGKTVVSDSYQELTEVLLSGNKVQGILPLGEVSRGNFTFLFSQRVYLNPKSEEFKERVQARRDEKRALKRLAGSFVSTLQERVDSKDLENLASFQTAFTAVRSKAQVKGKNHVALHDSDIFNSISVRIIDTEELKKMKEREKALLQELEELKKSK